MHRISSIVMPARGCDKYSTNDRYTWILGAVERFYMIFSGHRGFKTILNELKIHIEF